MLDKILMTDDYAAYDRIISQVVKANLVVLYECYRLYIGIIIIHTCDNKWSKHIHGYYTVVYVVLSVQHGRISSQ